MGSGATTESNGTDGNGTRLYFATAAIGTAYGTVENPSSSVDAAVADAAAIAGKLGGAGIVDTSSAGMVHAAAASIASAASGVTTKTVYLVVKPDLAGSYSILVASNATGRTYYAAGDTSATATFTTTGSVATVTLSALNTSPVGANPAGVVLKAVLKDSAGLGTTLGSLDSIQLTSSDSLDTFTSCSNANCSGAVTNGTLTQAMFSNGV